LPDDTRLWAALVQASGGVWGGCVYDADAIIARLAGDAPAPDKSMETTLTGRLTG
jgi:hypothetical protein